MIPVGTTYRDECTFSGEATSISAALYVNGVLSAVTVTLGTPRVIAGQTIQPVSVPTTGRAHGDELEIRVSGTVSDATETHSAFVTVSAIPTNPLLATDSRLPATGVIATVDDVPTAADIATAVNAGAVVIEQGDMQAELATYGVAKSAELPVVDEQGRVIASNVTDTRGAGADSCTITIAANGSPVANADVWISADAAGSNIVAGTLSTNQAGEVTFLLDAGKTYYLWMEKAGVNAIQGEAFVAVAD